MRLQDFQLLGIHEEENRPCGKLNECCDLNKYCSWEDTNKTETVIRGTMGKVSVSLKQKHQMLLYIQRAYSALVEISGKTYPDENLKFYG